MLYAVCCIVIINESVVVREVDWGYDYGRDLRVS